MEDGLSSPAIARRLGCSPLTVRARLKDYGIALRPRGSHRLRRHIPEAVLAGWPSPDLAYVLGLMASDGNLPRRNNCAVLTTTDLELANVFRQALAVPAAHVVETSPRPPRRKAYIVQICDHVFRSFLESRGLQPAKTLEINALDVPDSVFVHFLRGEMDGDGSWGIRRGWRGVRYLSAKFTSKSPAYLQWLDEGILRLANLHGTRSGHALVFNGQKAEALGVWLYGQHDVPCLTRKRQIWSSWMVSRKADT